MSKKMNIQMLIIDPQNDFCYPGIDYFTNDDDLKNKIKDINSELINPGALYVPGAYEDMTRLAEFIKRAGKKIDNIHVTLDSHHYFDISHPSFWVTNDFGSKNHPDPFTIMRFENNMFIGFNVITNTEAEYNTRIQQFKSKAIEYITKLKENGRYSLCIWPPHCLIGSFGYGVVKCLYDELLNWERIPAMVEYVTKGSNYLTEHYSAVKADVIDPGDPTTDLNIKLIETLNNSDKVIIAGEAKSHCVATTILDISEEFGDENIKKFVLLEDCMSNVSGFENIGDDFFKQMKSKGAEIVKSTEYLI